MSHPPSALAALSEAEKATVLDALLAARPDLRGIAETRAAQLLSNADRDAVADAVEYALRSPDIEELNIHAGYHPGNGYVHPAEAADEILDEALASFLHDLERAAALDMTAAAAEVAVGILVGLYRCRESGSETLLEYCPDYAAERAERVVARCAKLGIALPKTELLSLVPTWQTMMR